MKPKQYTKGEAGYDEELTYESDQKWHHVPPGSGVLWYNPPYSNILKAHNSKILLKDIKKDEEEKGCNCRNKAACPVANKCLKTNTKLL